MKRTSILIIDDDAAHRMLLRREIRACIPEAEIIECESLGALQRSLEKRTESPQIAFIDFDLQGESGLDVLKFLATHVLTHATAKIVLSTSALPNETSASLAAGAAAHLVKPGSSSELQTLIRTQLSHYSLLVEP